MTSKDQCREAFEEHYCPDASAEERARVFRLWPDGRYLNGYTQARYEGWQAARSDPFAPVELPEPAVIALTTRESSTRGTVEFTWGDGALTEAGEHNLYTEQQVRELLSEAGTVLPETPESPPKSTETRMDASSDRGGGVLPEPEVDLPRAGQKALDEYLKWCKEHLIVPDVGGAFAHAIRAGAEIAAAPKLPQGDGWLPIESAPKNQLVMVYSPPQNDDHPEAIRIVFDYIDAGIADEYWYAHGESYEHFCCVAKPEGCTGPSEKAPYTHWHPIPQPPKEEEA